MTITAPPTDPTNTYIDAVPVSDMFVDHSYQRELDLPRARRMAETWERPWSASSRSPTAARTTSPATPS